MSRKFVGNEDDWLDGVEGSSPRPRATRKPVRRCAQAIAPQESNAIVTEVFPNQSATRLDAGGKPSLCGYRMSTLALSSIRRERAPVCVGDRVRVEAGVIIGRCERRNRLVRHSPRSRDPLLHVLAANLDCLVIVAAAREPEFSGNIVDRFLVAASTQKIQPILCVNKVDLSEPGEPRPWSHYPSMGVMVVEASARDGRGTDRLLALLRGKTAVFCGHSGVGKTSLLRRLLADENYGRVGALSAGTGKGRHMTVGTALLAGPEGSSLIDTPGVMNFGLIDLPRSELLSHFPELSKAAGRCESNCLHDAEEGCALRCLPRHASYRQILSSL